MATADTTIARRRPGATGRRVRRIGARTLLYVVAWIAAIATLVPILYAILGGFRDTGQLSTNPVALPDPWVFSNYTGILHSSTFGREVFYTIFTLGLLFPVAIAILPIFIMVRNLGLLDNPLGVALPQAAFGLPMTIIILRPFFHSIPSDLQDAAAIDGCGPFRFFVRILLPLSRPVLATVSVLAIVGSWNAFLLPLVVLTDSSGWTLPLGVTNYSQQYTTDTAKVLAFTTLSMVPALIFYAFAERQLIRGLTSGAVKG
jgi:raffinose/stachyose/melibiose transport system permease protein